MHLLFLTSRIPYPPHRGDRRRAYQFLQQLAAAGHQITLVSFIESEAEQSHKPMLELFCSSVHLVKHSIWQSIGAVARHIWRSEPLQVLYYRSSAMQKLIDDLVATNQFDAVYIHLFRMTPYIAQHDHLYRIVDLTDVISREITLSLPYRGRLWRMIYRVEQPRIWQYEQRVARQFEEIWLISPADQAALVQAVPEANIHLVTGYVDTEQFKPLPTPKQPDSLVFVGHLGVFHNIDAIQFIVEGILPLVQQQIPECRFKIVGAGPLDDVEQFGEHFGVEVVGFVDDLNEALNQTAVFVAPLRFAAGIQTKVLEAMAAGLPVVTTPTVNSGLGASDGQQILLGETPAELAAQIVRLLQNQSLREGVGQAARRYVQNQFSGHHITKRLAQIEAPAALSDDTHS